MFVGNDVLDNVSIQHYYGDTLCEVATVARKHRLYVTNWWMFKEYKKALRRQGIGGKLFDEHWKWWTENVQTYYKYLQPTEYIGVDGSEKFWQYMGIEVG